MHSIVPAHISFPSAAMPIRFGHARACLDSTYAVTQKECPNLNAPHPPFSVPVLDQVVLAFLNCLYFAPVWRAVCRSLEAALQLHCTCSRRPAAPRSRGEGQQAAQGGIRRGDVVDTHLDDVCSAADRVRVDARRRDGSGACPYVADGV